MRIMIDTNILFSAAVFHSQKINDMIEKIIEEHTLIICSYVVDELYRVVRRKKPNLVGAIDLFLSKLSFEHVFSPKTIEGDKLFAIRDEDDYIILHTAIIEDVDLFITGDTDFYEVVIERPEILSPAEFLETLARIERIENGKAEMAGPFKTFDEYKAWVEADDDDEV